MFVFYTLRIEKDSNIILNSNNAIQELYPINSFEPIYSINNELIKSTSHQDITYQDITYQDTRYQNTKYRSKITTTDLPNFYDLHLGQLYKIYSLIRTNTNANSTNNTDSNNIGNSNTNHQQTILNMYLSNFKYTYNNDGIVNFELNFIEI